jgi:transposase
MTDGRKLPHDVLEAYRFTAINLYQKGISVKIIASACKVGKQAVYKWITKASDQGRKSLKSKKAPGPSPLLTENQFKKLKKYLHQPATELGYLTDLWTGPKIRHLIKNKFKIIYHEKHMPRLLRKLGLTIKFPERRALEHDPVELRKWKKYRLPKLLKKAKKTRSLVVYADESLISLIPYVGKTWTFPNAKPIVRVSGLRGHIGATAAVNRQGRICFELTRGKEKFTAKVFIRFIKKMHREFAGKKIILIVDGAPIHKAGAVKEFEKNSKWLTIEILPAYSPAENPTEKLWWYMKTKKLNGSTVQSKKELRAEGMKILKKIKKKNKIVPTFFE